MFACSLIGASLFGFYFGLPRFWFTGGFIGGFLVAPMSWWFLKQGRLNSLNRHSNIFYENSVTQEEVERIRHLDAVESLGTYMQSKPGYGYFQKDARHV